jgi:hypothetical protein
MGDRPTCVGCGTTAPDTDTNHTLISSTFGWRLTRRKSFDGTTLLDWRCATCWRKFKDDGPGTGQPPVRRAR